MERNKANLIWKEKNIYTGLDWMCWAKDCANYNFSTFYFESIPLYFDQFCFAEHWSYRHAISGLNHIAWLILWLGGNDGSRIVIDLIPSLWNPRWRVVILADARNDLKNKRFLLFVHYELIKTSCLFLLSQKKLISAS